jgi:hypothetical protein
LTQMGSMADRGPARYPVQPSTHQGPDHVNVLYFLIGKRDRDLPAVTKHHLRRQLGRRGYRHRWASCIGWSAKSSVGNIERFSCGVSLNGGLGFNERALGGACSVSFQTSASVASSSGISYVMWSISSSTEQQTAVNSIPSNSSCRQHVSAFVE